MNYDKQNREVLNKIHEHQRNKFAGNLSEKIIGSLNDSFMGPQTVAWLKNMNEDMRVSGGGEGSETPLTSTAILDKLFDEFQRYAFQFNRHEPNREYIVSCKRMTPANLGTERELYEGYCYNSHWALLVRAQPTQVTLSIVAPRFIYEQVQVRENLFPILQFVASENRGGRVWSIHGNVVGKPHLPTVAKAAFARLIRVTRRECKDLEPLTIEFIDGVKAPNETDDQDLAEMPTRIEIITDLILTMLETVNAEIDELERVGIKAVRSDDTNSSNILLARSKGLQEFRFKTADLARNWSEFLSKNFGTE